MSDERTCPQPRCRDRVERHHMPAARRGESDPRIRSLTNHILASQPTSTLSDRWSHSRVLPSSRWHHHPPKLCVYASPRAGLGAEVLGWVLYRGVRCMKLERSEACPGQRGRPARRASDPRQMGRHRHRVAWSTVRGLRWRWPRARDDGGMLYTDRPCTTSDRSVGAVAAHRRRRTPRTQMAEMREQLARTSPGATFLPLKAIGCCTLTMHDCTAPAPACAGMHQRWRWRCRP